MRKGKRISRKVHRAIIKVINYICGTVFLFSVCIVDAQSWIPFVAMIVSGLWLTGYAWANGMFYNGEAERK